MTKIKNGESQNLEYKESWRDEYLKWICGFANACGGSIYIGLKTLKSIVFYISHYTNDRMTQSSLWIKKCQ